MDPNCNINPTGYLQSVRNGYSSISRFSKFNGVLRCGVPANRRIPAVVLGSVFNDDPALHQWQCFYQYSIYCKWFWFYQTTLSEIQPQILISFMKDKRSTMQTRYFLFLLLFSFNNKSTNMHLITQKQCDIHEIQYLSLEDFNIEYTLIIDGRDLRGWHGITYYEKKGTNGKNTYNPHVHHCLTPKHQFLILLVCLNIRWGINILTFSDRSWIFDKNYLQNSFSLGFWQFW